MAENPKVAIMVSDRESRRRYMFKTSKQQIVESRQVSSGHIVAGDIVKIV